MDSATGDQLDPASIGRRVTRYRERLGFRQAELAKRASRSEAYVNRLEHGLVRSPKIGDLAALARALGVSLDALIYGESPRTDADILEALARQPRLSWAMASIVKGLQWAPPEDREFVLGHLESLARRFGDDTKSPLAGESATSEPRRAGRAGAVGDISDPSQ